MSRETLVGYYDKLATLVEKLPGGLQKPIMHELRPIREVFLDQRPARLLILGDPGLSTPDFLCQLANLEMLESAESEQGWRRYRVEAKGSIQILDAREVGADWVDSACQAAPPDLIVILRGDQTPEYWQSLIAQAKSISQKEPSKAIPLVGVLTGGRSAATTQAFRAQMAEAGLGQVPVFPLTPEDRELLGHAFCGYLPNSAKLEFARLMGARRAQAELARSLLNSFSAICGVVGTQPIPIADLPVLASLQTLMVGLIIYVSGRKAGPRLIAEFLGAVGVNFGAGLLLREGARTVVRFVPGFGSAVSGFIAGGGTFLIGKAAIAYFIEGKGVKPGRFKVPPLLE